MWSLRREAARAVLLDEADRVLLLEASDPADPGKGTWWELPGGGMEPGEPSGEAAARELFEETGIAGVDMGGCVWQHRARFTFAGFRFDQQEHIHVARMAGRPDESEYRPGGLEAIEAMAFKGWQWWSLPDLRRLVAGGGRVIPPWLCDQLPSYLTGGGPGEPIDMGELGDVFRS
ncbi:MAG: NUDIX domain-containing protein [Acidimicrobiales bacterium]|nr:NUDIX domain-containing protein [Acidimicrobiales bacterium]